MFKNFYKFERKMSILEPCIENVPDTARKSPQDVTEVGPDESKTDPQDGIEVVSDQSRNDPEDGSKVAPDEQKGNPNAVTKDIPDEERNDPKDETASRNDSQGETEDAPDEPWKCPEGPEECYSGRSRHPAGHPLEHDNDKVNPKSPGSSPISQCPVAEISSNSASMTSEDSEDSYPKSGSEDVPDEQRNDSKDGTEGDLQDDSDERKKYPKECYPGRRRPSAGYHSHPSSSDSNTSVRSNQTTFSSSSPSYEASWSIPPEDHFYPYPVGAHPWPVAEWPCQDWYPICGSSSKSGSKTSSEGVFKDSDFPLNKKTFPNSLNPRPEEWIRVPELSSRVRQVPIFVPEDSHQEVYQRQLPNCWLIPGMSKLTKYPNLFRLVVPPDQTFTENYDGKFRFNLWNFGNWEEVVVDDRIPVDDHDEHFGALSSLSGVYWPPLLEKAFAKHLTSYNGIFWPSEAMTALTGGLCEFHVLDKPFDKKQLTEYLKKAVQDNAMICAGTPYEPELRKIGLFENHNYSVVKVFKTFIKSGPMKGHRDFIVLKNPHEPKPKITMYQGPWSQTSLQWNALSNDAKSELMTHLDLGEFCMTLDDFYEV